MREEGDRNAAEQTPGSISGGCAGGAAGAAAKLILEVYRQRLSLAEASRKPSRVVLSRTHYDTIREYHLHLGTLPQGLDYIDRYRIFDLEICIDDVELPRVE